MLARDHIAEALAKDPLTAPLWNAGFRARVGVSACLMGEKVRYDGDDRRSNTVAALLPLLVDVVALCPEVAIGMGVPRPPVQVVRLQDGRTVVRGVDEPQLDVTARLDDYASQVVAQQNGAGGLHGYVFKARSPSCGPGNAPLFDEGGAQVGVIAGRYAGHLREAFPGAPMGDEEALRTVGQVAGFVIACYSYAANRQAG
jgi:uncharacterized protein YbbK (DUF523 family)